MTLHVSGEFPVAVNWGKAEVDALRHLISEARKVEALREWTKKGYKFFPEMIDGFEWAQCEVQDILNAPDTGGK
jgi:hypothetical protein